MPSERHKLYFQWEVRSWSRALPHWEQALQQLRPGSGRALALGERDGGLSLMLADRGFRTVCSDLNGPSAAAVEMHARSGHQDRITHAAIDATAIALPDAQFDVVIFKSMLGALRTKEMQVRAVQEMHRVLRPGGLLLFAENLHGTAVHRWLRKRFVPWEHYWRYLDARADADLFKPFAQLNGHTTGLFANLGRSEGQRDVLARMDGLVAPLLPATWRTIWYGVAVKGGEAPGPFKSDRG